MNLALDHVVIAARSLDEGVAWCEATLGVTPGPGGAHVFMGTHNRLLRIDSAQFPRCYLEIIAIDPQGTKPRQPRWFDLDSPASQGALETGPKLWHWVARTPDLSSACDTIRRLGADVGEIVCAQRETAHGTLRWRITIRPDGRLLCHGALPTLIEWSDTHPADSMQASAVQLSGLRLRGLMDGVAACLPTGVASEEIAVGSTAPLQVEFTTPRGPVQLSAQTRAG